jgi:acyl CoA:acetate/3-ketoacid CoA transferase beta subunit
MGIIGKKSVLGTGASAQCCAGDEELVFALNHCSATLPDRAEDVNGKMRG